MRWTHPAYGLDHLWNACCWNSAATDLFHAWLNGAHQRNLLPPAEADIQQYFASHRLSHQMMSTLERAGFIRR